MRKREKREPWSIEIGKLRNEYIAGSMEKIKVAKENGLFIEQIAIYESLIADRIEARIGWLQRKQSNYLTLKSLGAACMEIKTKEKKANKELFSLYDRAAAWYETRHHPIHACCKITIESEHVPFAIKYSEYQQIALEGAKVFKALSGAIKKVQMGEKKADEKRKLRLDAKAQEVEPGIF